MSYKIEYIASFYMDVQLVMEFLSEYPGKARRIFARTDKILRDLGEMPEMYPIYQEMPSFRFIVIEDYLVFYKVKKEEKLIEVHRLLYGRIDIPAKL